MTRRSIVYASAALAILLLSNEVNAASDKAHAERDVNLDDLSYTERLQAVKDGLAGQSTGGGIKASLLNVKDRLTGNSFDTQVCSASSLQRCTDCAVQSLHALIRHATLTSHAARAVACAKHRTY